MFASYCREELFPDGVENFTFAKKWVMVSEDLLQKHNQENP